MKYIATLTIMGLAALTSWAQEEPDTVAVIRDAKSVTLTTTDNGVGLVIRNEKGALDYKYVNRNTADVDSVDDEWNVDLPFLNKKKRVKYLTISGGIYLGYLWTLDAPHGLDGGFEVGFKDLVGFQWRPTDYSYFSIGLGLNLSWFYVAKGMMLDKQDRRLILKAVPEGVKKSRGTILIPSLLLPATYTQKIYGDFGFTLTAMANFCPFLTRIQRTYSINGYKYKENIHHIQKNFITPEFMFSLGWLDTINVYVKYNPCSRFRSGYGPEFKSLSCGMIVAL